MSRLLRNIVNELSKRPGIGRRTSMRLALHLLKVDNLAVEDMTVAICDFLAIPMCKCNNLSDSDICPICSDPSRDQSTDVLDGARWAIFSIESSNQYRALYHVLGGVISDAGNSSSDLKKVDQLIERVASGEVKEVIMAISTSIEGETTRFYLMSKLREFEGVKVTNLARGIGFGDELEYVDELTIAHAIKNSASYRLTNDSLCCLCRVVS